jgi:uncharacterized protein YktA (UPF0223 family)
MIAKIVKRASNIDDSYVYEVEIWKSDLQHEYQVYKDVVDSVKVNDKELSADKTVVVLDNVTEAYKLTIAVEGRSSSTLLIYRRRCR